ncbi:uncharacterized protein PGTG_20921 [Puccinia graminis f. sp. tritici CRL 75-36-700-3]|uniref:CxC1-like cysteine cluster associated with KDZ transposases domain-containing protein n=1 Tax=Puccinia graminis f. sp. tritici (strain CRL 75-36-700-3 / race SCCL) TaxID=418459 RepID=H6QPX1_PUCGT|nr:uncharacterized protein PGTG_20921 [Puccinia graminis f. sp. tritici CRL 75-36-700-3]EHS64309.1 hypothetical protein PGTG_20921 [Puccinia graminis f. sp. tritici CRL 75-36-700-3]
MTREIRNMELLNKPANQADRCADAHKAADDKRNESTWKGCDDTGIMGCCCRHDAAISMCNIYKSGEQRSLPLALLKELLGKVEVGRPVGVLYDIGCSLHKYIGARGLLSQYTPQLTFGTSIFHSYVHNWMCQLDYNPRFNIGWGLSDGEGLERLWSFLSPLVSPLRYASRNHRLGAIAHRVKHHNTRGIRQLSLWLSKKFKNAVKRRCETQDQLARLLSTPNPFNRSKANYTVSFFKKQWAHQKTFRSDHTDEEQERRNKLIKMYEHREALEVQRQVESFYLIDCKYVSMELKKVEEELGDALPSSEVNDDEQRLLLLLWNSKHQLYIQAVQLHGERQPYLDSKRIGTRLGTELKEKIMKAMQNRQAAVKSLLDSFNKLLGEFIEKFPNQQVCDSSLYPLEYKTFSHWPLDHHFWNDGLYMQCKEPWAIDPNVRAGINCVLILSRVQEEFQLIAQELARATGWAVAYYSRISDRINYISRRIALLANEANASEDVELDYIDNLELYGLSRWDKLRVIRKLLRHQRSTHVTLVNEWHSHVLWLNSHCQPANNRSELQQQWQKMRHEIRRDQAESIVTNLGEVDVALEEGVLEVGQDDGEDADGNWMTDEEVEDNQEDQDQGQNTDESPAHT